MGGPADNLAIADLLKEHPQFVPDAVSGSLVHQLLEPTVRVADPARRVRLLDGAAGRGEPLFGG